MTEWGCLLTGPCPLPRRPRPHCSPHSLPAPLRMKRCHPMMRRHRLSSMVSEDLDGKGSSLPVSNQSLLTCAGPSVLCGFTPCPLQCLGSLEMLSPSSGGLLLHGLHLFVTPVTGQGSAGTPTLERQSRGGSLCSWSGLEGHPCWGQIQSVRGSCHVLCGVPFRLFSLGTGTQSGLLSLSCTGGPE